MVDKYCVRSRPAGQDLCLDFDNYCVWRRRKSFDSGDRFDSIYVPHHGGGNGSVYNNLLLNRLPRLGGLYAMFYSISDQQPRQYKGRLWNWTIGQTPSLGMVFTRVKKQRLRFPRLADCSSFLSEIWCETAEYDGHKRAIEYTHPETQPDDTLHAINYVTALARMALNAQYG